MFLLSGTVLDVARESLTFTGPVSWIRDNQLLHPLMNHTSSARDLLLPALLNYLNKVYVWWKHALDIPSDTTRMANMDLDSEDQQYHDMNTQRLAFMLKSKIICLVSDRSFLYLGLLVDSFRHCAATINWLIKTTPSTIEISLRSGFDNTLKLEQHWCSHSKRLSPPVWSSGLRLVKLHTHLSTLPWPQPSTCEIFSKI